MKCCRRFLNFECSRNFSNLQLDEGAFKLSHLKVIVAIFSENYSFMLCAIATTDCCNPLLND